MLKFLRKLLGCPDRCEGSNLPFLFEAAGFYVILLQGGDNRWQWALHKSDPDKVKPKRIAIGTQRFSTKEEAIFDAERDWWPNVVLKGL